MDTLTVLMKARERLAAGWLQGDARDFRGNVCAVGALTLCSDELGGGYDDAMGVVLDALGHGGIVAFNDAATTTQADVLALFDRAINSCVPVGDSAHVHHTAA